MKDSFLICAFPRSRTMWLSAFLTVPGYSIVTHEACEFSGSAYEFWANAELYACSSAVYGNSDSANVYVLPSLLAERPMTRVLWVPRPIVEVAISMKNARMPHDEKSLRHLVDLREKHKEYFDLIVDFHDLERADMCKVVWEFCLPGVPFDYGRWGKYNLKRIGYSAENPFPQKTFAKFLDWVKREMNEEALWRCGGNENA